MHSVMQSSVQPRAMSRVTSALIGALVASTLATAVAQPAAGATPRARHRTELALRGVLEAAYASELASGHTIVFAREELGCATLVRAHIDPMLYPGTGVATVLADPREAHTYGQHGDRDLAELGRACGWLRSPPAPDVARRFVSAALYEGMIATRVDPVVASSPTGLTITIRRAEPMSGDEVELVVVGIAATGPANLTRTPL